MSHPGIPQHNTSTTHVHVTVGAQPASGFWPTVAAGLVVTLVAILFTSYSPPWTPPIKELARQLLRFVAPERVVEPGPRLTRPVHQAKPKRRVRRGTRGGLGTAPTPAPPLGCLDTGVAGHPEIPVPGASPEAVVQPTSLDDVLAQLSTAPPDSTRRGSSRGRVDDRAEDTEARDTLGLVDSTVIQAPATPVPAVLP